jgi:DNA invertase Pin-like site-specific DNA recombinase
MRTESTILDIPMIGCGLGMKGTMSELELSLFRQRSQEALKHKAHRGALFLGVAGGYGKTGRDRIEKDHDAGLVLVE